jgi:anti-sigma B factor antagonist
MPEEFRVDTVTLGRVTLLRAAGRLDARTTPQLLARCSEVRKPGVQVVLNLAEVSFVSSSGVGALLAIAEEARLSGGGLRISPPSAAVRSAIELLNLDQFLTLDETEQQALDALAAA